MGSKRDSDSFEITPQVLLRAYACGVFPMSESADDPELFWVEPERRGLLPLDQFHIPRRLKRTVRSDKFTVKASCDFQGIIKGCAEPGAGRKLTWINGEIHRLYTRLYEMGYCQTIEVYNANQELVGGLYGVDLGGAFFGESMFSRERDASKIALVHLIARMIAGGYTLLDTQFITAHLQQFGAVEIPKEDYTDLLDEALCIDGDFSAVPDVISGAKALEIIEQKQPQKP